MREITQETRDLLAEVLEPMNKIKEIINDIENPLIGDAIANSFGGLTVIIPEKGDRQEIQIVFNLPDDQS